MRSAIVIRSLCFASFTFCTSNAYAEWHCRGTFGYTDINGNYKSENFDGNGANETVAWNAVVSRCKFAFGVAGAEAACSQASSRKCEAGLEESLPPKVSDGPQVSYCVRIKGVKFQGWNRELFGDKTGNVQSCIVTPPNERVSAIYCYLDNGYLANVPDDKLSIPGCYKFDDYSSCDRGYASMRGPLVSYIGPSNEHVVCVSANAQEGSGNRFFGIVGGDAQ